MPRPPASFDSHRKYFENLDIVEPNKNMKYNNNTKITIICKNNKTHTYKLSVNQIKNQNKNPYECPHCKNEQKSKLNNIQYSFIKTYAETYNLDFEPKKDSYNRWENDTITFTCKKCNYSFTIKALAHWEKNQPQFECPCCKLYTGKSDSELIDIFSNILNKNIISNYNNTHEKIITKELTPAFIKLLEKTKDTWDLIEYHGTRTKAKFVCKTCGSEKYILPLNFRDKNIACRTCFLEQQKRNVEENCR
jgi:hypothetical protein